MKLFSTSQISEIDRFTIDHEPIADIDLMERASKRVAQWLVKKISIRGKLFFFAGPGNNGGDALAIARIMSEKNYDCSVFIPDSGKQLSGSSVVNFTRLKEQGKARLNKISSVSNIPKIDKNDLIIDGLFGSGLTRPVVGIFAEIIHFINNSKAKVISIDIPSGLFGEDNRGNNYKNIVKADVTLTFQFPKICFLFPENEQYTGKWEVLPIGLHPDGIRQMKTNFYLADNELVSSSFKKRKNFSHKGTFGHTLIIAGSYGKMGASVLASKAALRSGTGLLTSHIPRFGYQIIQTALPEAMTSIDQSDLIFTECPNLTNFSAVGIGPGIGLKKNTQRALYDLLGKCTIPMVLDADALNILSLNKEWIKSIPPKSILTPHPGEFTRLVGEFSDSYTRLMAQSEFAKTHNLILILKGAYTSITMPDGNIYFNSTGNPGMATAGSGDVLTGIITGILAQGIIPEEAAIAGVYLHGLAGDYAMKKKSEYSLIAGDIIDYTGEAFKTISLGIE